MDERTSPDRLPPVLPSETPEKILGVDIAGLFLNLPPVPPSETPEQITRNTGPYAPTLAPEEDRAFPEVPGYEILGILGRGGMGVVYKARQIKANRLVALKMIRAVEHATPQDRLRFQIETEAVACLHHPHIVQLYEAGEVRGQPYFSLEFCDGGTLGDQLKKRPLAACESAALIETLARAMHYAHLRGVVHRDLKPGNVLLASPGRESGESPIPKITDFGLAKRIDAEARNVSQSGAIMGTASYMAPEQAAGKVRNTGPAADVYALGALLYWCLTGQPPFDGPQLDVLVRVVSENPLPPSQLNAKVPRDLETICLKCLSKEPARRYASGEELANDLRRFQAGEPIRARRVGPIERAVKWVRRNKRVVAVLLMAALGLAGIVWKTIDAERQKVHALREADKAKKTHNLLLSIFKFSDQKGEEATLKVRPILEHLDRRIATEFSYDPEFKADMEAEVEDLYSALKVSMPQAMILEARGTVELKTAKRSFREAVPQTLLYQDDRLILGPDADVRLVFLWDFRQERLRPGREVSIHHRGCHPRDAVGERNNDVLLTFVPLPQGMFFMGGGGGKAGKPIEIMKDFEIAAHDVTQWQWETIMGDNPSWLSRSGKWQHAVKGVSDEELKLFPVEMVSWDDVQEFIKRLNEKERGRGYLYRLPSEAEWEYACRGGATSEEECSYHFYFDKPSNDLSIKQANFWLGGSRRDTWSKRQREGNKDRQVTSNHATRVGSYPSNKLGLCDMHGNVRQWCADRAIRGGSWMDGAGDCSAISRSPERAAPTYRDNDLGFRLVRVPVK